MAFVGCLFMFPQIVLRPLYLGIPPVIFSAYNESLRANTKSFSLTLPNSPETSNLTFTLSVAMDTSGKAADWAQQ